MENKYIETGTIFRKGDSIGASGTDITHAVRKVVAEHRRLLQGPHGPTAGKRVTTLLDGTVIVTSVNPYGLVPTLMATVTYPSGKVTEEEFWCEAGLMTWDPLTPYYPLRVYVGDKLKTLPIPQRTDDYYNSHYWLTTRPDIEYPDYGSDFYTDTKYWPSFWTGKARLMLQGLHAIARHPAEIFTNDINPTTQGIWTVTPGKYWVASITAAGAFVTKLVLPVDAPDKPKEALAKLLSGEEMSEVQRSVAEACYMAHLVRSGDPIEILSSTDMTPLVTESGGSTISAMAYGWKFARNKLEASIVTFKETAMPEYEEDIYIGQFVTSLFTITAECSIAEDTWTATVDQVYGPIRSRPRGGVTSIYVPSYGSNYQWNYLGKVPYSAGDFNNLCCFITFSGNVQPQYCWYNKNDELEIVWYIQHADVYGAEDTRRSPAAQCSRTFFSRNGTYGNGAGEDNGYREGGWVTRKLSDGIPLASEFRDPYYSYTNQVYEITVNENGSSSVGVCIPAVSDTCFLSTIGVFCDASWIYDYYYSEFAFTVTVTSYHATVREYYELQGFLANPRLWALVISAYDAESAYILAREKSVTVGAKSVGDGTYSEWGSGQNFTSGHIKYEFERDRYGNPHVDTIDWVADFSLGMQYGIWAGAFPSMSPPMVDVEPEATTITPASYKHYSPHGEIDCGTAGQWGDFFPESVLEAGFIAGQPIRALRSYLGDGLHYVGAAQPVNTGGYEAEPGIASFYIGGA